MPKVTARFGGESGTGGLSPRVGAQVTDDQHGRVGGEGKTQPGKKKGGPCSETSKNSGEKRKTTTSRQVCQFRGRNEGKKTGGGTRKRGMKRKKGKY